MPDLIRYQNGLNQYKKRDYLIALDTFNSVIDNEPNFAPAIIMRAMIYAKLDARHDLAFNAYLLHSLDLKNSPHLKEDIYIEGPGGSAQKQPLENFYEEALAWFDKQYTQTNPAVFNAHQELLQAVIYLAASKESGALEHFIEANKIFPNDETIKQFIDLTEQAIAFEKMAEEIQNLTQASDQDQTANQSQNNTNDFNIIKQLHILQEDNQRLELENRRLKNDIQLLKNSLGVKDGIIRQLLQLESLYTTKNYNAASSPTLFARNSGDNEAKNTLKDAINKQLLHLDTTRYRNNSSSSTLEDNAAENSLRNQKAYTR